MPALTEAETAVRAGRDTSPRDLSFAEETNEGVRARLGRPRRDRRMGRLDLSGNRHGRQRLLGGGLVHGPRRNRQQSPHRGAFAAVAGIAFACHCGPCAMGEVCAPGGVCLQVPLGGAPGLHESERGDEHPDHQLSCAVHHRELHRNVREDQEGSRQPLGGGETTCVSASTPMSRYTTDGHIHMWLEELFTDMAEEEKREGDLGGCGAQRAKQRVCSSARP